MIYNGYINWQCTKCKTLSFKFKNNGYIEKGECFKCNHKEVIDLTKMANNSIETLN